MGSILVHGVDTAILAKLLLAASATLESDLGATRASIEQAADLLRGYPAAPRRPSPGASIRTGGLAPWQEKRVIAHVEANISSSIRAVDLAQVARLSVGHFSRAFRQSFGQSPLVYVAKVRIHHSQSLMLSTQAPLSAIALECGMNDQAHFTRVFRKIVGMSPGLWRRQFADDPALESTE